MGEYVCLLHQHTTISGATGTPVLVFGHTWFFMDFNKIVIFLAEAILLSRLEVNAFGTNCGLMS